MEPTIQYYSVYFQIKDEGDAIPSQYVQDAPIHTKDPTWIPMPGDSIDLIFNDQPACFIVLTRHFSIFEKEYSVHIVVRTATDEERDCRINR